MRSLNRCELVGRLGADPELRYTQTGDAVVNLSIATHETWKDKQTGEPREETEWHRVVLWRKTAEIAAQYCTKGSRLFVAGPLKTRKWQDQEGQDRYTTELQGRELLLLDGAPPGQGPGGNGQRRPQPGQPYAGAPGQQAAHAAAWGQPPAAAGPGQPFDDDIPF